MLDMLTASAICCSVKFVKWQGTKGSFIDSVQQVSYSDTAT